MEIITKFFRKPSQPNERYLDVNYYLSEKSKIKHKIDNKAHKDISPCGAKISDNLEVLQKQISGVSSRLSLNDSVIKKIISESQDRWGAEEELPDVTALMNEFEADNPSLMNKLPGECAFDKLYLDKEGNNVQRIVSISIEETKHDNDTFPDSINEEIDQLLLGDNSSTGP